MKYKLFLFPPILFLLAFIACAPTKADSPYQKEIKEWHAKRIENLTQPTSWLSLAGLHWLDEGDNTFGNGAGNKITFQNVKAPEVIGTYIKNGGEIFFKSAEGVEVMNDSSIIKETKIVADADGDPTVLEWGSLSWYIIKRGERYGIRLRDTQNPNLLNFEGIELFDIDPAWKVKARFVAFEESKKIAIPNILGMIDEVDSFGELQFQVEGKEYSLAVTGPADRSAYFFVFADLTNGKDTYGAGRFLVVDGVDSTGVTTIDFNKAYNPPCAFSKYATCPLPPEENKLRVEITAGEKAYHGAGH